MSEPRPVPYAAMLSKLIRYKRYQRRGTDKSEAVFDLGVSLSTLYKWDKLLKQYPDLDDTHDPEYVPEGSRPTRVAMRAQIAGMAVTNGLGEPVEHLPRWERDRAPWLDTHGYRWSGLEVVIDDRANK